ncbi:MAG: hypothetical protein ABFS28_05115 [Bacteroidota bacterium]
MRKLPVITALLLIACIAFGQNLQKGNLIGVHHYTLTPKDGYTLKQVVEFYVEEYCPAYSKAFPGIEVYFTEVDRGEFKGQFGMIYLCESKKVRDMYWPEKGLPSDLAEAGYKKLQPVWDKLGDMVTLSSGDHTDFIVY